MSVPQALIGTKWTAVTARRLLPVVVKRAQKGQLITYGELDKAAVQLGGHHVLVVLYGWPAGAMGNALIELEKRWDIRIPPLNAIIVNAKERLPGKGVDYYLRHYFNAKNGASTFTLKQRKAIVEEIHSDVFAFKEWHRVLRELQLKPLTGTAGQKNAAKKHPTLPKRGGWSTEPESEAHKRLKNYVAKHPSLVGLPRNSAEGKTEYVFYSADKADVVFKGSKHLVGVEVKSHISNDADLNKGLFQAVKYQALLRAEQKAVLEAPTATAVLVTERILPERLAQRAALLGIAVVVVKLPRPKGP